MSGGDSLESTYAHVRWHFTLHDALNIGRPFKSDGTFLSDMFALCGLLAKQPIYVPIHGRNARPAQLIHDAQDELANAIKGLPNYSAYIRLRTDPVHISRLKLAPPARRPAAPQYQGKFPIDQRWAEIYAPELLVAEDISPGVRTRSRERFGTPRAQVEQEIGRRREHLVHGQVGRPDAENSVSPAIDLAQATARAKWQREHPKTPATFYGQPPVHEQSDESSSRPASIGRRSPKKK